MISDDWIAGFVAGEGCFSITIQLYTDKKPRKGLWKDKARKCRSNDFRINPSFRINVRQDDRPVLEEVRNRLGVGEIYIQSRKSRTNLEPTAHYYVQTMADLLKIKEFFSKTPICSKKQQDFELWCRALI